MHLLAAVTHVPGLVIAQDRIAKAGKANEISHFKPMLAPLPLEGAVATTDAMQAKPDDSLFLRAVKGAHWLWPVPRRPAEPERAAERARLGETPVAAATARPPAAASRPAPSASSPRPKAPGSRTRSRPSSSAVRHVQKGQWRTRAESVLYLTSLGPDETTPQDLLAHVRGHWPVEIVADCTYE